LSKVKGFSGDEQEKPRKTKEILSYVAALLECF